MRVLLVVDEMQSITDGGTERQILQIVHLLRQGGVDVEVAVFRGTEWLQHLEPGLVVHQLRFSGLSAILQPNHFLRLSRLLKQFDVVLSFFVEANVLTPIVGRIAGVPVRIGSRRNVNHWMTLPYKLVQSLSNIFVTRLAANCNGVRKKIEQTEYFSKGKIDVIYNGIDTDHFHPDAKERQRQRTALGIGADEIVLGNTSTLRAPKGVDDFIRAASTVANALPARILIVGDGPLRRDLEQLAVELGVADRTIFAGAQSDVRPWLAATDIAVLSSHAEGFSNSILEYMACGLPCVVSDVGGNAEAVSDCGTVVPAGDVHAFSVAILDLAGSKTLREELGTCARSRALLFSLPSTQKTLINYYRDLRGERS